MRSNKGFTLIELLAVIVVLAIIALIATPIVLNLINDAKVGAAEQSGNAFVKATETAAMVAMIKPENTGSVLCTTYTFDGTDKLTGTAAGTETCLPLVVDIAGKAPEANGTVTFDSDGTISAVNITVDSTSLEYTKTGGCKKKASNA